MIGEIRMTLAAFAAAYGVGFLPLLVQPFLIGASIVSLGLSGAEAGLLGTAEFAGIMIGSLAVAPMIGKLPRRTLAITGTAVAIACNLVSIASDTYTLLVVMRIIAGLGCGAALASGNATIANSTNPERVAGNMALLFVILMILTSYGFAWVVTAQGLQGAFAAMAGTMGVMLILLIWLPQTPPSSFAAHRSGKVSRRPIISLATTMVWLGGFMFAWRDMMQWAFIERIGVSAGLPTEKIGSLLSLQAFIGLLGPLSAMWLARRIGLTLPLLFGIISSGAVTYLVIQSADDAALYRSAVMFVAITYFFALSYLSAMAAGMDREGRVAAGLGSFMMAGATLAPVSTGFLIDRGGYDVIGFAVIIIVAVTIVAVSTALLLKARESRTNAREIFDEGIMQ